MVTLPRWYERCVPKQRRGKGARPMCSTNSRGNPMLHATCESV
nr:MAG TPA: hypothetical protein [Caudoviricetes sp.]